MMSTKHCYACLTEKEHSAFYPNKAKKDGLSTECKDCSRSKALKYHHANGDKVRESFRLRKYGLTPETFNELVVDQDNSCAICQTHADEASRGRLFVDHCHSSGKVRGLLCHSCNLVIGHAKDNIETLTKSINYLRKNNEQL